LFASKFASSIGVHLAPYFLKLFNRFVAHWQLAGLCLADERVNQNRNKEIQEDLCHDDLKALKENK